MALLPYIDAMGELVDGAYFHLLPFCKKNCSGEKCKEHYQRMRTAKAGGIVARLDCLRMYIHHQLEKLFLPV